MGLAGGPNITEDGLVFAYDTGNITRSYRGKPITNILTAMGYSYGEQDTALFKTHYGLEDVYIPAIGKTTAHFCEVYNDYNGGSGNCCPSLFGYGGDIRPGVVGGATYTYQIIYRTTTGYAHPNYMYHYEYSDSGYITEYGLWNASREEDLGDGWKHAWGTFTLNAATTRLYCYLFHYEYATFNKVQVAGVMLHQNSTIIPPRQFIPHSSTRSATEGLLDIAGNTTIDLSSAGFQTNGQLYFDGTSEVLNISDPGYPSWGTNPFSIELVFKVPTGATWYNQGSGTGIIGRGSYAGSLGIFRGGNEGEVAFWVRLNGGNIYDPRVYGLARDVYHHVVGTFDGVNTARIYHNGTFISEEVNANNAGSLTAGVFRVGGNISFGGNNGGYGEAEVPIAKLYNRVLTADEIEQNFQGISNRFSI